MNDSRSRFKRASARLVYPVLGVAMTLSAVLGGLERSQFLSRTTPVQATVAAIAPVDSSSSVADSAVASAGIDLTVDHPRIDSWVTRLTTSLKSDFEQSLGRMDKYDAMITAKLDERQMPHELKYLAMIESNFNPTAKSRVGAVGMWQFMSATARQFGLTVKGKTDERKDPAQATDAALSYLSALHDRFGSWYLAAAAYNSGAGTVSKALRNVTGKTQGTDEDFFRILSKLPRETQDYVPKLIASAMVGSDPAKYGIVAD